jgi:hypothetical protein
MVIRKVARSDLIENYTVTIRNLIGTRPMYYYEFKDSILVMEQCIELKGDLWY